MRNILGLIVALLIACAVSLSAAVPVVHPTQTLSQQYPVADQNLRSAGYDGNTAIKCSTPGFLMIDPGTNWANYVGAASAHIQYVVKNVVLQKKTPSCTQCADVFPAKTINQERTVNIRLMWPLMYEIPGTTWTLTLVYGTTTPYDDDGPGPNPAGYIHTEVWVWRVGATPDDLSNLLTLFHQLPFGLDEVPLISDEVLFPQLMAKAGDIKTAVDADDEMAAQLIGEFEMMAMDACISMSPSSPAPTGPETGIANSAENPACCKLLVDAEYLLGQLNSPPDCSKAYPSVSQIWPPISSKLVSITIKGVKDPNGDPVKITIVSIFQDEPTKGQCTGDLSPDGFGGGTNTAKLRAERSTMGDGRVYTVTFDATDTKGGTCRNTVKVSVPRLISPYLVCTDGGPLYDSTKK